MRFLVYIFFVVLYGCGDYFSLSGEKSKEDKANDGDNSKFVFKKNNFIYWGSNYENDIHKISSEALDKVNPAWSPNGSKILFARRGAEYNGSSSLANLVIVDEKQSEIAETRVLKGWVDGVFIDGLRVIEEIGWFDSEHVFVSGSVNPNVVELRLFDFIKGTELPGYLGTSFAVCPKYGKIAFLDHSFNKDYFSIMMNDHEISKFQKKDEFYSLKFLKWIKDCTRLSMIESEIDQSNIILIDNNGMVEKRVKIPIHPVLDVRIVSGELLLMGESDNVVVRVDDFSIINNASQKNKVEVRLKKEKELGVDSADWYP